MLPSSHILSLSLPPFIADHIGWWVAGLIVVVGLFRVGLKDLLRLSGRRIWAIGGVVFDESIRKRVLLIAPLAMLGVVIVGQFQRPTDELEAVRALTKFCLFATGLVVVVTTIILTCTNLPREIENRVIFTIVTKPTTRLEIIAGKITGFARVSAAILLMMGAFSWLFLSASEWQIRRNVSAQLEGNDVSVGKRSTYLHYRDFGLLEAKTLGTPTRFEILARPEGPDQKRWITANGEQDLLVPFDFTVDDLFDNRDPKTGIGEFSLVFVAEVDYARTRAAGQRGITPTFDDQVDLTPTTGLAPTTGPYMGPIPFLTEPQIAGDPMKQPLVVSVQLFDPDLFSAVPASQFNAGKGVTLPMDQRTGRVESQMSPSGAGSVLNLFTTGSAPRRFWFSIGGGSPAWDFAVRDGTAKAMIVNPATGQVLREFSPAKDPSGTSLPYWARGRSGRLGQQIRGTTKPGENPIAIAKYRGTPVAVSAGGDVPVELVVGIERSGADLDEEDQSPTTVEVEVVNTDDANAQPFKTTIHPESRQTTYFNVPSSVVKGGNFDVHLRCKTDGHWIDFSPTSLSVVIGSQPFAWNLLKSLFVLWLMSVLVISIALLCSTFLSWPIAVVLTIVMLLGHWGVSQLGDAAQAGIGNAWANQLFPNSAPKAKAVSSTVEGLNKALNTLAAILPDISQYRAAEAIQRGISVPFDAVLDALKVTLGYGLPMSVLAYIFLRNKEVAP